MEVEEALNRLGNTDSFLYHLKNNNYIDFNIDLSELKIYALRDVEKIYSKLNNIASKQEFTSRFFEIVHEKIEELQNLNSDNLDILMDFERTLKTGVLKEFYSKRKVDLTHAEQMLFISYMQDLKILPQISSIGRNADFFTIFSALLNRNVKNSEKYLYDIKSKKKDPKSLEKILAVFKKAKSQKGQELVMNDLNKLKKDQ